MPVWDTGDWMCGRMRIIELYPAAMRMFRGGGAWELLIPIRLLASIMYGAAVMVRRRIHRNPVRITGDLLIGGSGRPRVISIGNLVVGGGGKTPCAMALAEIVTERGGSPVVVMRGYRSHVSERHLTPFVVASKQFPKDSLGFNFFQARDVPEYTVHRDPDGHITYAAGLIGDEAVLYHGRRIPVVIDGDRVRGAEAAARLFAPTHILIDYGFQNHRICKDVDILLLDARRPFGDGRLLPAGTLRERADAARRADVVIFTRAVDDTVPARAGQTSVFRSPFGRRDYAARGIADAAVMAPGEECRTLLGDCTPRIVRGDHHADGGRANHLIPFYRSSHLPSGRHLAHARRGSPGNTVCDDGEGLGEIGAPVPGR